MEIGFASLIGVEPVPFAALVERAARCDIRAIEVNVGPTFPVIGGASYPGHIDLDSVVRTGPGAVLELLHRHGVRIASLAPMLNLLTLDDALQAERVAAMRQTIDVAAALGVPTVVTYAGSAYGMHFWGMPGVGHGHSTSRVAENLQRFQQVYEPLAEYAGERGVRIAFETAARGGPEGNLAHSPELWDYMFDVVPSPNVGLSFDPSHLIWLHISNAPDVVRAYGPRIFHVDGKDCEILPGQLARQGIFGSGWWRYRLPGFGAVDWRAIVSALADIGYDDVIAIENEDPLAPGWNGVVWAAKYLRTQLLPAPTAAM
jgi:sugar phosphate isomerase/epimerase